MRPWILLIPLCACTGDLPDETERAAKRVNKEADHLHHQRAEATRQEAAYAHARIDFEELRTLRVAALRAEHSVVAIQPLVITTLAGVTAMTPVRRARLDESVAIFRQRLALTRELIGSLDEASAREWKAREDAVHHAMASMIVARDASWNVLEGKRDDRFPDT
jgi:hypothetical protein